MFPFIYGQNWQVPIEIGLLSWTNLPWTMETYICHWTQSSHVWYFRYLSKCWTYFSIVLYIPAKLQNHEIVSVHFNRCYCTDICDKLSRDLAMLTYIYLNVDNCWSTSSMSQWRFKLQLLLNNAVIPEHFISED